MESDVATEKAERRDAVSEQDGLRQIVSALRGAETTTAAASDVFRGCQLAPRETML